MVIWFTGLSGAGKTTLARQISSSLLSEGISTQLLDGDIIRRGLSKNLGFTAEDRLENIRRVAEVSKLFIEANLVCVNAFITPTNEIRKRVYQIIGRENIFEVFVNTPINICKQRDPKGLYKKVSKGEIRLFSGIDAPFEAPENPDLEVRTDLMSEKQSVDLILKNIIPALKI